MARSEKLDAFAVRFGPWLKSLREQAGLSQEGLARAADASLAAVTKWEQAVRVPGLHTAATLARVLGVSLDVLGHPPETGRKKRAAKKPAKGLDP